MRLISDEMFYRCTHYEQVDRPPMNHGRCCEGCAENLIEAARGKERNRIIDLIDSEFNTLETIDDLGLNMVDAILRTLKASDV